MSYLSRITHAFDHAPLIPVNECSKFVIMSDCHRGIGNANDNFLKNETLFQSALQTYYKMGYSYIELGDGDELWENRRIEPIQKIHDNVFCILKQFRDTGRLYMLYGNHDYIKSYGTCCREFTYYGGLILEDCLTKKRIYLTHGHQADVWNSTLWKLSRFLVRYVWKPLELFGIPDPTSAAKNYQLREKTEFRLLQWADKNNRILVCGHTHRATAGPSSYFNSGCCIYPGNITALELSGRQLTLVKWTLGTREDRSLYVARELLSEPVAVFAQTDTDTPS